MSLINSTTLKQWGSSGVEKSSAQAKRRWRRAHNGNWENASSTTPLVEPEVEVVSIVLNHVRMWVVVDVVWRGMAGSE